MNLLPLFSLAVCVLVDHTTAVAPEILNTEGNGNLEEKRSTDLCVYQLEFNASTPAVTCTQTTSFPMFRLEKRGGDPDWCVYYLSPPGGLVVPSHTVTFTCDDGAAGTTTGFVKIDIQPNAPPTFDEGNAVLKIVDAATIFNGDTIFTVAATDPESDAITYSIDTTDFDIDASTGAVKAKSDLNSETTLIFNFNVQITDGFHPVRQQSVTLNLNNLNKPPYIRNFLDPVHSPEDVAPGQTLFACTHDEPGPLTKTFTVIPASEQSVFQFTESSCTISVQAGQNLDFERVSTMTMTITLNDGVYTNVSSFTFNVLDVNEPPVFDSNSYTMDINEGPPPLTPAVQPTFGVTDDDAGDTRTFSLATGTDESHFTIDSSSGALTSSRELDYDAGVTQFTVIVVVTDSGGLTGTTTLTVNIADINDNAPEFSASTTLYISPNTVVGILGSVAGTDKDSGNNALLTYSLVSDSSGGNFQIMANGSVERLTPVTEAERNRVYSVVALATDGGTPPRTEQTTVTILFNPPPVITNMPNVAFISEDTSTKTTVFQIDVTDADTFTCDADSVLPSTNPASFIVEQSGGDWVVSFTGSVTLSVATTPTIAVGVICTDSHNGKSIKNTLTVFVRQNQPPFIDCSQNVFFVDASTANTGDTIRTVAASDVDPITYNMNLLPPGAFTIDQTGKIVCQKQMIRESPTQYIGAITVNDTFNIVTCSVTLSMTNTNGRPDFADLPRTVYVDENMAGGDLIATVTITDPNQCGSFTHTWDVDPAADRNKFSVTLATDVISLSLRATASLDHETVDLYRFYFTANDGCLNSQAHELSVRVRDINEPPEFRAGSVFNINVLEANSPAVDIGCDGWDPDKWDTHTLTLTGQYKNRFRLSDTSRCTILPVKPLDVDSGFPTTVSYTLTMTDRAGLSAEATLNINIQEVNDNDPVCSQPAYSFADIFNGDTAGRVIGTVAATDADLAGSVNSQLTYSIVQPSSSTNVVGILPNGEFRVLADPATEFAGSGALLDFTVQVTDNGSPPRSTTCNVNVHYIHTTTTPPPPSTVAPTAAPTTMAGSGSGTGTGTGTGTGVTTTKGPTFSSVETALSNPVVVGLIAALGALILLAAIAGLCYCCRNSGSCHSGSRGSYNTTRNWGQNESYQRKSVFGRSSPKSNQVGTTKSATTTTDISTTKALEEDVSDKPTTLKYL